MCICFGMKWCREDISIFDINSIKVVVSFIVRVFIEVFVMASIGYMFSICIKIGLFFYKLCRKVFVEGLFFSVVKNLGLFVGLFMVLSLWFELAFCFVEFGYLFVCVCV